MNKKFRILADLRTNTVTRLITANPINARPAIMLKGRDAGKGAMLNGKLNCLEKGKQNDKPYEILTSKTAGKPVRLLPQIPNRQPPETQSSKKPSWRDFRFTDYKIKNE